MGDLGDTPDHAWTETKSGMWAGKCYWCDEPTEKHLLTIGGMQVNAWLTSDNHGFHDVNIETFPPEIVAHYLASKLALIHQEVSEALDEVRRTDRLEGLEVLCYEVATPQLDARDKPVGFMSELADIIIRVGDLAGIVGGDLEEAVKIKMAYNNTRPHKHGRAI